MQPKRAILSMMDMGKWKKSQVNHYLFNIFFILVIIIKMNKRHIQNTYIL